MHSFKNIYVKFISIKTHRLYKLETKLDTTICPSVFINAFWTLRDRIAKNIVTSLYRRERVILMIDSGQYFNNKMLEFSLTVLGRNTIRRYKMVDTCMQYICVYLKPVSRSMNYFYKLTDKITHHTSQFPCIHVVLLWTRTNPILPCHWSIHFLNTLNVHLLHHWQCLHGQNLYKMCRFLSEKLS